MIVACPKCSTKYNLPDEQFRPGAKARCTVCAEVFPLKPGAPSDPAQASSVSSGAAQSSNLQKAGDDLFNSAPGDSDATASSGSTEPDFSGGSFEDMLGAPSASSSDEDSEFSGHSDIHEDEPAKMWGQVTPAPTLPPLPGKKEIPWGKIVTCLLLLLIISGGVWFFWNRKVQREVIESRQAAHREKMKGFSVEIERQFTLPNDKIGKPTGRAPIGAPVSDTQGKLYVVEGVVTNNFASPKASIKVAVSLLDDQGRILATKEQFAGTTATPFQLSVMDEKDLEQYLNNPLTIMSNNSLVLPGGKVPFTVVFYRLFNKAASIQVSVIDASDPNF